MGSWVQLPRDSWHLLIVLFAATLLGLPIIVFGLPNGHSLVLNLVWSQEFANQVLAGDLYPRWLSGMNSGAGSPAFYFYGPFPFYVSTLTSALCPSCSPSMALGLAQCIVLAGSGLACFYLLRMDFSAVVACTAAVVYLMAPYHLEIDLWRRQAFAEFATYLWIPLILIFARRTVRTGRPGVGLAVSYAGLLYTHLPVALLFSPFLAVYTILNAPRQRLLHRLVWFLVSLLLGLALAAPYLAPALTTQHLISPDRWWSPYYTYNRWFFLDGKPEPGRFFGDHLFYTLLLSTCAALLFKVGTRTIEGSNHRSLSIYAAFSIAFAWFLMTPISQPIWELLPTLQKVQFPWRVAVMLDVATAMLCGLAAHYFMNSKMSWRWVALLSGLVVLASSYLMETESRGLLFDRFRPPQLNVDRDWQIAYRRDTPEYYPQWVPLRTLREQQDFARLQNQPLISYSTPSGSAVATRTAPTRWVIRTSFRRKTVVTLHQFYYPAWTVKSEAGKELPTFPSRETGLLQFTAPAGQKSLLVSLKRLPSERLGFAVALLSILSLALLRWYTARGRAEIGTG